MLEVVPLGGLGEFGMNMLALTWGETTIVVDAGVMFPDPELLGVDRIIPDLTYLQQKGRAAALVLTHGHEDHIGGVPHVVPLIDGPIYGTPLTLALVEPKLEEHGIDGATGSIAVRPRDRVAVGPFEIEFIRVTHSMPDCVALAIHTPAGVDRAHGRFQDRSDADRRRALRRPSFRRARQPQGVLALFADSTNIDRRGFTGSELEVVEAFEEIFTSATGKLIVAAFASSIYRMQILVDLAAQFDRKVAFVGRGMMRELRDRAAARLPAHSRRRADPRLRGRQLPGAGRAVPDDRVAGRADVGAVADRDRRSPPREGRPRRYGGALGPRDSRATRKRSAGSSTTSRAAAPTSIHEGIKHVHVSGHGSEEELKLMLSLVRPRYFIPVHGEYRQLSQHARIAGRVFAGRDPRPEILLAENGDMIAVRRRRRAASPARRRSAAC